MAAGDANQAYTNKLGPNSSAKTQREVVSGLVVLQPHHTSKDMAFQVFRRCYYVTLTFCHGTSV